MKTDWGVVICWLLIAILLSGFWFAVAMFVEWAA